MAKAKAKKRSPKAGRPVEPQAMPPRVRRRRITAHATYRKDTTIHQAADIPRAAWAGKPRRKKA
ncbi:MAG TPA: hypothetical protein VIF59_05675 [Methylomirabilota bacterium]|jgi:hypothetical protein